MVIQGKSGVGERQEQADGGWATTAGVAATGVVAAPHRTAPHRTAPHRTAPHRTAPHRNATHTQNRTQYNHHTNSDQNKRRGHQSAVDVWSPPVVAKSIFRYERAFFVVNVQLQSYERALFRYERAIFVMNARFFIMNAHMNAQ